MRSWLAFSFLGLVALLGAPAATSSAAPRQLAVLGFQPDYADPALIDENATAMTLVGIDGVHLKGAGAVSAPTSGDLAQLEHAHAHGLRGVLLVANFSEKTGGFSERLAHRTLGSAKRTDAAAASLGREVAGDGFDGVSVDLEALASRDKAGLARFVRDLQKDLPKHDSLTICISASASHSDYAAQGYDLPALAASVDQIVLMAYDLHGPWETTPGPVGPLAWQRASVAALEQDVPAAKIFLGVANYGYVWSPKRRSSITVAGARALAHRLHVQPRWIKSAGEWTARHRRTTAWWSNKRSIRVRLRLARTLGVHGVAVWALGTGDPLP